MKHMKMLALVAVVLVLAHVGVQAECISIANVDSQSPPKPPEPIRVAGAICGKAVAGMDLRSGPAISLTNGDLDLIDADTGAKVGKIHVDSRGDFRRSKFPVGRYRVGLAGFTTSDPVEITTSGNRCEQPLLVKMVVAGECSPASHISTIHLSAR